MERLHFSLKIVLAFLIMSMLSLGMAFQFNTQNFVNAEESAQVEEKIVGGGIEAFASTEYAQIEVVIGEGKTLYTSITTADALKEILEVRGYSEVGASDYDVISSSDYSVTVNNVASDWTLSTTSINTIEVSYLNPSGSTLTDSISEIATAVQLSSLQVEVASNAKIYNSTSEYGFQRLRSYLTVTGVNNDGSLYNNGEAISDYDLTGEFIVGLSRPFTVLYNGVSEVFYVDVLENQIVSLSVDNSGLSGQKIYSSATLNNIKRYIAVTATYSDGSSGELGNNEYDLDGSLYAGRTQVTTETFTTSLKATVGDEDDEESNYVESAEFDVEVIPAIPTAINVIIGDTYIDSYLAYQTLQRTGITVSVSFSTLGGERLQSKSVSNYDIVYQGQDADGTPATSLRVDDEYVTISYTENGETVTDEWTCYVYVDPAQYAKPTMDSTPSLYNGDELTRTINGFDPNVMRVVSHEAKSYTVDENAHTVTFRATNADKYEIVIGLSNDNYVWSDNTTSNISFVWEIRKATIDSSSVVISDIDYGETANPSVSNNPGEGLVSYYYYGTAFDGSWQYQNYESATTTVPTKAGNYYVYAVIAESSNYSSYTTGVTTFQIRVADNTITAENYDYDYDEQNANAFRPTFSTHFTLETNYTIEYFSGQQSVGATTYNSQNVAQGKEFFPTEAGEYRVVITVEGTDNYNEAEREIVLTINRKEVAKPSLNKTSFTYNYGQLFTVEIVGDGLNTYFELDELSVSSASVAGDYEVILNLTNNYAWTGDTARTLTLSWKIERLKIAEPSEDLTTFTYDGKVKSYVIGNFNSSAMTIETQDDLTIEVSEGALLGRVSATDAGTYEFAVSIQDTKNFAWLTADEGKTFTFTFTINRLDVAIPTATDVEYNGEEQTANVVTNEYYTVSGNTGIDADEYSIELQLNNNYKWQGLDTSIRSQTLSWNITQKEIGISWSGLTTTYNGDSYAPTATATGTYARDEISLTVLGANSEAGEWTAYVSAITGTGNGNYILPEDVDTSFTILRLAIPVPEILNPNSYVYADGEQVYVQITENGVEEGYYTILSGDFGVDSGEYNLVLQLTNNYQWDREQNTQDNLTLPWNISKRVISAIEKDPSTFTYTSADNVYQIGNFDALAMNLVADEGNPTGLTISMADGLFTGELHAVEAGVYVVDVELKNDNYAWAEDVLEEDKQISFTVNRATVEMPTVTGVYRFTGESITNNVQNTSTYTVSGNTETVVGSYSTIVTLRNTRNYMWTDLTDSPLNLQWQILKAQLTRVLADTTTYTYDGTAKTYMPVNFDSQTMSISGNSQTLANEDGYTVTVSIIDTTNYEWLPAEEGGEGDINPITFSFVINKAGVDVGEIVSEPVLEGDVDPTDRGIPFQGAPVSLIVDVDEELFNFADVQYLNSSFEEISAENIVSYGVYYEVLELVDSNNYKFVNYNARDVLVEESGQIRLYFQITRVQFDMGLSIPTEITYGTEYNYSISNNPGEGEVSVSFYDMSGDSPVLLQEKPVDVGEYRVTVSISASGNYTNMESSMNFEILPKLISVTISVENGEYGEWQSAEIADISGLVEGYDQLTADDFNLVYIGINNTTFNSQSLPQNVGDYLVSAQLKENITNYYINETQEEFSITKAVLTITFNDVELNYGDSVENLENNVLYSGFKFEDDETSTGVEDALSLQTTYQPNKEFGSVGEHDVTISLGTFVADNYSFNIVNGSINVSAKQISLSVSVQDAEFDGESVEASAEAVGLINEDDAIIVIKYYGTQMNGTPYFSKETATETAPTFAGNYYVIFEIENDNYVLDKAYEDIPFEISKFDTTVEFVKSEETFVYNGEKQSAKITASYLGVSGDVSVSYSVNGDFKNVGEYVFSATLSEDELNNYNFTSTQANFEILKYSVSVKADDGSMIYGNNVPTLFWSYEGDNHFFEDISLSVVALSDEGAVTSESAVAGSYHTEIVVPLEGEAFELLKNYEVEYLNGTFVINKRSISISISAPSRDFNGQIFATPLVTVNSAGVEESLGIANEDVLSYSYSYVGTLGTEHSDTSLAPTYAGTYEVSVSFSENNPICNNYTLVGNLTQSFEIRQRLRTVSWLPTDRNFVYDGLVKEVSAFYETLITSGTGTASLNITIQKDGSVSELLNAGTYTLTADFATELERRNYTLSESTKQIEVIIAKADIDELVWLSETFVYNGLDQSINGESEVVFATFIGAQSLSHNLEIASITKENVSSQFKDSGRYVITVKLSSADEVNYNITAQATHEYVIQNATIIVNSINGYTGTYDALAHDVVTGEIDLTYVEEAGTPTISYRFAGEGDYAETLQVTNAGTREVEYQIVLANHNTQTGSFQVSVTPKDLTLQANGSIYFGNEISSSASDYDIVAVNSTSFAGSEGLGNLQGTPQFSSTNYIVMNDVGDYSLKLSGYTSNNYNISYVDGVLRVEERPITVTIISGLGHIYNSTPVVLNSDTHSSVSGGIKDVLNSTIYNLVYETTDGEPISMTSSTNQGLYNIDAELIDSNYVITEVIGGSEAYEISPKVVTIRIDTPTGVYDGTQKTAGYEVTSGDSVSVSLRYSGRTFGGENYPNDSAWTEEAPTEAGNYTVTATIDNDEFGNYAIYEASATFEISRRSVTIRINDQRAIYSGLKPTVSSQLGVDYSVVGEVGICEDDELNIVLDIPENSIDAGTYTISGKHDNANYYITFVEGEFEILQKDLTITADNKSVVYGSTFSEYTVSYSGFVNGENEEEENIFSEIPTATSDYVVGDSVGRMDIYFESEAITSTNYNLIFVEGVLTIESMPITIQILPQSSSYTGTRPTVSSEITENYVVTSENQIYNGDNLNIVLDIAENSINAGSYDIIPTYSNANYTVTFENYQQAYTINKVVLTVSADNTQVQYGNSPINTYSITGFVNNENESVIEGLSSIQMTNEGFNVGANNGETFDIEISGSLSATNYDFSFTNGTLQVVKREINIAFDTSKFYNSMTNVYGEYGVGAINSASAYVVGSLVGEDTAGDEEGNDVQFVYRYFGTANDGLTEYDGDVIPTLAGSYQVEVQIVSDNYTLVGNRTATFIVIKQRVTSPQWQTEIYPADGSEHTNTLIYDADVSFVLTSSHPISNDNAGTVTMSASAGGNYSVTLELIDPNNYVWADTTGSSTGDEPQITIVWTISQNNDNYIEITGIYVGDELVEVIEREDQLWFNHTWTYGDSFQNPEIEANYGKDFVRYTYYYASTNSSIETSLPVSSGEYYVIASIAGTSDYNGVTSERVYFNILKQEIPVPTISGESEVIYNHGTEIRKDILNYDFNLMFVVQSNVNLVIDEDCYVEEENVGEYYLYISLIDSANYAWQDSEENIIQVNFKITPYIVSNPTMVQEDFVYDGTLKTLNITNTEPTYYEIIGNSATNAGSYSAIISLKDRNNYVWADSENSNNLEFDWSIQKQQLTKPTWQSQTFTYSGSEQEFVVSGTNANMTISGNYGTNAGSYTLRVSLIDKDNFEWTDGTTDDLTQRWSISQKILTQPQISNSTYNHGEVLTSQIQNFDAQFMQIVSTGNAYVTNSLQDGQATFYVNARLSGSYQISISLLDTLNTRFSGTNETSLNITWLVSPFEVTKPSLSEQSYEFNGEEQNFQLAENDYYEIVSGGTGTNVGINTVTIALIDKANYVWSDSKDTENISINWSIYASDDNVILVENEEEILAGWTYGQSITPIVSDTFGGAISIEYFNEGGTSLGNTMPSDAGNYYFVATSTANSENFNDAVSDQINFTIRKASFDMSGVFMFDATFTYDGNAHKTSVVGELPESVEVNYVGSATNVSEGKVEVVAKFTSLDENYLNPEALTAYVTILPREVQVVWENLTFTYNGNTQNAQEMAYYLDVSDEEVYLSATTSKEFKNVGSYEFTILDISDENYRLTGNLTQTYEITPLDVNIKVLANGREELDITFGEEKPSITYTLTTNSFADEVTISADAFEGVNVGRYEVSADVSADEGILENYNITVMDAVVNILPRTAEVIITSNGGRFNNVTPATATSEDILDDTEIILTYRGWSNNREVYYNGTEVPSLAGSYIVEASVNTLNYTLTGNSAMFFVDKAVVSSPTIENHVYDGTTYSANLSQSAHYQIESEEGSEVGEYDVVLTLNDAYNYKWSVGGIIVDGATITLSFNITKAQNSVTNPTILGWSFGNYSEELGPQNSEAKFGTDTIEYLFSTSENGEYVHTIPQAVGSYYVKAYVPETNNYYACYSDAVSFEITSSSVEITPPVIENGGWTYGENAPDIDIDMEYDGVLVLTYYYDNNGVVGELIQGTPQNAGKYWVVASVYGDENFNGISSTPVQFEISKREIAIPTIETTSQYAGEEIENMVRGLESEYVDISGSGLKFENGEMYLTATSAGTYTITIALKDKLNTTWQDGSTEDISLVWEVTEGDKEESLTWLVITLSALILVVLIWIIVNAVLKRKYTPKKDKKALSLSPLLLAPIFATNEIIISAVLGGVLLILFIVGIVLHVKRKRAKKASENEPYVVIISKNELVRGRRRRGRKIIRDTKIRRRRSKKEIEEAKNQNIDNKDDINN